MNVDSIIRNAENQVAAALKNKVERLISATKNRDTLLMQINQLTADLNRIVSNKVKVAALPALPPKNRVAEDPTQLE